MKTIILEKLMNSDHLKDYKVHPLADVKAKNIGKGTTIWQYCVVFKDAEIGNNCNVNCFVLIENDVLIGNNVTIKSGVQVWDGISLEDNVMVGPNVTFTNDKFPKSKREYNLEKTLVKYGATIGAGSTILPGITIGRHALVGAGSVVTKDVPDFAIVRGNPSKKVGYITRNKTVLNLNLEDKQSNKYKFTSDDIVVIK